ncbi:hypothetical protein F442_12840 [Phytophthora nicotianae P10297]|uniref:HAT C-terminal dimerisation domain-containing protein n=1 Tax=Phytophthora nicotianae P10297 TaxID=1317064 RepID=W2YYE9_PHYNI|nr:hypothetical protein F442_12840 [Phytophthora nicotianae P10297]
MPDQFGLILDGWTHMSEHYLGVFACYEVGRKVKTPLICMAPLMNEIDDDLSALAHREFLADMLPRDFGKQIDQCLFVVGGNCSVNQRLASLIGVPLIGCASHRLNRVVQQDLQSHEADLAAVHGLMIKLRTLTQSAKLSRLKTSLRPVIRQDTRWSSTFAMLHRYFKLLEHLDKDDDDVAELLPGPVCNRRLRKLLKELANVESVSKALQGSADLLDVREWFDGLIAMKPLYAHYLAPRADIVHSPDFESGCVRVLRGNSNRLTRTEKAVLQPFAASVAAAPESDDEESSSFGERLQKRRKLAQQEQKYVLIRSIPPTSNIVERFFSIARTTFGQERNSLQPATLEQILFLRQNASYWDVGTIDSLRS